MTDRTGRTGAVVGVREVHQEVLVQQELDREVEFDALTGLAKRPLAVQRIARILSGRPREEWGLLCVEINGITAINTAFTYAAGDEVLQAVASRLVEATGGPEHVARIAGDEFAVILPHLRTATDAANAAERLLTAARGPVSVAGTSLVVTVNIGITMADERDAETLLRDASTAMRQAAASGPDRWEFLASQDIAANTRHILAVQEAVRGALAAHRIEAWYMPVVSLVDGSTRGYEALARWLRMDETTAEPVEFLEATERSSLVVTLDREILHQVMDAMAVLPVDRHIAANISAPTLASGDLDAIVRAELDRTGAAAERLHLEVTETALLRPTDAILDSMRSLAALGITWWVDDFGTGYSSIAHLRDLPIGGLKLDKSFTSGVTRPNGRAARLASGLGGLAAGLGLATIAEGVETTEQAHVLRDLGWQMGQGWLYGKAAPLSAAVAGTQG